MVTRTCCAAAALIAAQPLAAADLFDGNRVQPRSGAFAGATLTIGLDGSRERPSPPRLRLGVSRVQLRGASPARVDRIQTPGVELTLAAGEPRLLIGGEPPASAQKRLGMSRTTTTLLVLGGLALGAFAILELTGGGDNDENEGPCPIAPPC